VSGGLANLWELLTALGGGFALSLIVALALGIAALTLLFAGSAVVVLERFARARRSPAALIAAALLGAVVMGFVGPGEAELAGADLPAGPWAQWGLAAAAGALRIAVAVVLVWLALRWLRPATLARASLALLGLGYAAIVGGSGAPLYAAAPVAATGAVWGLLALRRRGRPAGEGERLLRVLVLALAAGVPLAVFLPEPAPRVAVAGQAMLGFYAGLVLLGLLPLAIGGLVGMRGSAEWFIAVRYLLAKRRQTFISVITLICVMGVAAGVWLTTTVLSVMNGFERTWRDEIIGNRAHFTVQSGLGPFENYREVLDRVLALPHVVAASPYLDAEGMVRGSAGEIVGVRVRGVDPDRIGQVTDLREDLVEGSLDALRWAPGAANGAAPEDPPILIGSQLASALGLQIGDPLVIISPFGGPPTPFGPGPRLQRFRVGGVFRSSLFQYDEVFTYVSLPAAQDFRRTGDVVHGIEVRVEDVFRSRRDADRAEQALGFPFYTRDWKEFFPAFFQALKTERVMMFVLLTMIMVVAAFAIVVTLIMMIMEKSSDIAILKAMGASDATIERIFAIEGTLIGLVGTGLGVLAGLVVVTQLEWIQDRVEAVTGIDTLPANVYPISTLPWQIDAGQLALVVAVAMMLSLGATLLPSRQGARLDPAEGLRHE
jgi:lipoprotein-releasing system permease protein